MRIIVAHPGKQHSFRLATAVQKSNSLLYYVTTLYNKKNSFLFFFLNLFLSNSERKRASGRRTSSVPDKKIITFCSLLGLLELALLRIDKTTNLYRRVHSHTVHLFGIRVAKLAIKHKADAVICYDSNACSCFRYLKRKAPNIKRILDVSIASRHYLRKIYNKEIEKTHNRDLYYENSYLWDDKIIVKLNTEMYDTDFFLVASDFVRDSILDLGIKMEQIFKIPYGANVESNNKTISFQNDSVIHFLFVGQVIYRKGITYALEAMTRLAPDQADFSVVGPYNPHSWFIEKYNKYDNIHFVGPVTFDMMKGIYDKSTILLFPSLAEGMAQVGIEAMACGLPIICTYNSGLSDLVIDGVNGFIVPESNVDALFEKMLWIINNRNKLQEMSEKARLSASAYSWDSYEIKIGAFISNMNRL